MKLQLNDKYRVETDTYNYILQERKVPKEKGKSEYYVNIGYYGSIEFLVKGLLENEIKLSEITELSNVVGIIENAVKSISESIRRLEENE